MQLELPGRPHLTYCTNIHAGESWNEIASALSRARSRGEAAGVAGCADGRGPAAVGQLPRASSASRARSPSFERSWRRTASTSSPINAFPYGPFHGTRVKEAVYEPDWRAESGWTSPTASPTSWPSCCRTASTGGSARCPAPIASVRDAADVAAIAERDGAARGVPARAGARTGKPSCSRSSRSPAASSRPRTRPSASSRSTCFGAAAIARFCRCAARRAAEAERALRRHLGLCFDVCHAAVGFEDTVDSVDRARAAGIRIAKLQLSAALKLGDAAPTRRELLEPFDDGIYLHQTVEARDGALTRYPDLPEAFAALRRGEAGGEWRVHCHVPVFRRLWRAAVDAGGARRAAGPLPPREVTPHLEVETYTWDVLPAALRDGDVGATSRGS